MRRRFVALGIGFGTVTAAFWMLAAHPRRSGLAAATRCDRLADGGGDVAR